MKQEDKELLLKDICSRWPYDVVVLEDIDKKFDGGCISKLVKITEIKGEKMFLTKNSLTPVTIEEIRPYLRPLSSMTEEENKEYIKRNLYGFHWGFVDWCNSKHLDYRGLIGKGLALEAQEWMYNV